MLKGPWRLLVPLLLAAFLGCEPTHGRAPRTPHGGMILPIPENKGAIEILKKPADDRAGQVRLVAYFYGPDDKPMAPMPTAASFTPSARGARPIDLKDAGGSDSSMVSEPFPDAQGAEGKLLVTIGGKPIAIPVMDR